MWCLLHCTPKKHLVDPFLFIFPLPRLVCIQLAIFSCLFSWKLDVEFVPRNDIIHNF